MFKNIVVGTDGSDSAAIAVHQAAALAKTCGATLHVVHAFSPVSMTAAAFSAGSGGPIIEIDRLNESIATGGAAVVAEAAAAAAADGVAVQTHNEAGDPTDVLIRAVKDVSADLLVVGNRGMTGLKRFMLGSVPNKIAHHAPCSLLIVDTTGHAAK
jgi:nucleotide-binding universal stress UspA family protein